MYISKDFLLRLLGEVGPSGFENDPSKVWKDYVSQFAWNVFTDFHGNSFAEINKGGELRFLLSGHIDEIGLMVSQITEDGFIRFVPIGGWDTQILQGQRVWIKSTKTGKLIPGGIGKKPIHLLKDESERNKVPKIEDLWIDIGANSKAEVEEVISIGDPIVLAHTPVEIMNGNIMSRAIDNRVGAFTVAEALRMCKELGVKSNVVSVATVQEEIGLRGAYTSAYRVNPHIGIAVDVTFVSDDPGTKDSAKTIGEVKVSKGPVITRGPNINQKIFNIHLEVAKKYNIPYQIQPYPRGTGTDANIIQLTREGPVTSLISIPTRYLHTPIEICNLSDLDNAVKIIAYTIKEIEQNYRLEELVPF
ncbi:MAG: M42 family metallopeptidase [Candidatus Calescibacterium sp.]|nr:M42 family metallopeptidase [Candidatus Calescibacterium sp.]MCX7972387.1 M42 family metallopeptidase [bacterium]MDW8195722.1 M42 family metallopeptidase [Candidatus Calescibacterium sp.]